MTNRKIILQVKKEGERISLSYEKMLTKDIELNENIASEYQLWQKRFAEYNKTHSEPFGSSEYSDAAITVRKNLSNNLTPIVPGNPNRILSESVRLSTASEKTHVNNNTIVLGGIGTGKSFSFLLPNIMQMNGSYIINDPGGMLYKTLKSPLKKNGYKVRVVNFLDLKSSCKTNPFHYIQEKRDIEVLADCFILNTGEIKDEFGESVEKSLLMSMISYLIDFADKKYRNFTTILWMLEQEKKSENDSESSNLDKLFEGKIKISHNVINGKVVLKYIPNTIATFEPSGTLGSFCKEKYSIYKAGGKKISRWALLDMEARLSMFKNEALQEMTKTDTVALEKIGNELTALFVITSMTDTTYSFMTTALILQAMEILSRTEDNARPYHVAFMLDEFPNSGKLPENELEFKLAVSRRCNFSMTFIAQSMQQLKALYPETYDVVWAICDVKICLGINDMYTSDFFSKELQRINVIDIADKKAGVIITGEDLMFMSENKCIVIINDFGAIVDRKYDFRNHLLFSKINHYM